MQTTSKQSSGVLLAIGLTLLAAATVRAASADTLRSEAGQRGRTAGVSAPWKRMGPPIGQDGSGGMGGIGGSGGFGGSGSGGMGSGGMGGIGGTGGIAPLRR